MTTKITEQNVSNLANFGVQWQSVFVGDGSTGLTTVAGRGYFINTTGGTVTVTLPASPSVGDTVVLKDYARTFQTNAITINPGSSKMDGASSQSKTLSSQGNTSTVVYMDDTRGWTLINEDDTSKLEIPATFTAATGGTVTESGDFKIHSFTGDSNFVVSSVGNAPSVPTGGPNAVSYVVVAGGGAGGRGATDSGNGAGGGGAGGFREGRVSSPEYTASPLVTTGLTVTAQTYPITVGGGGSTANFPAPASTASPAAAGNGSNSVFSTITSTGGGGGGNRSSPVPAGGAPGGSGGGSVSTNAAGAGNTPPVSPPQGNPGATATPGTTNSGTGGGGATAAGGKNPGTSDVGGAGGAGATTHITGSPVAYAGGGGGGGSNNNGNSPGPGAGGAGGAGGGGTGANDDADNATTGTANRGGGGGAGSGSDPGHGGKNGGKGIVIIRYKFQ